MYDDEIYKNIFFISQNLIKIQNNHHINEIFFEIENHQKLEKKGPQE